jgi:hypothetical protein
MSFGAEARARLAVLPVYALVLPWRCSLGPPRVDLGETAAPAVTERRAAPAGSAATEKREAPVERVSIAPPHPARVRTVTLPDQVVVKAMAAGQVQFLRCWSKAQQDDPGLDGSKVVLHLDIDAAGKVIAAHRVPSDRGDPGSPAFERCLARVARNLPFPAPGQPAVVELPLMFP